jgi:hypothetical protein
MWYIIKAYDVCDFHLYFAYNLTIFCDFLSIVLLSCIPSFSSFSSFWTESIMCGLDFRDRDQLFFFYCQFSFICLLSWLDLKLDFSFRKNAGLLLDFNLLILSLDYSDYYLQIIYWTYCLIRWMSWVRMERMWLFIQFEIPVFL